MDKKFVMSIAAMAALTLVSCSSDDLDSLSDNSSKNEAISFDSYLGRSAVAVNGTRGSVLDNTTLKDPANKGFGVFGNYSSDASQKFGANFFNNEEVTYSSSPEPAKWTYTNTKYWPSQGHIDFLAYAPYDSKYNDKVSEGNQKLTFTVNSTIKDQKDLLWANTANKTNGTVTFNFAHALSRLGYTVKLNKAVDESKATITLKNITLAGSPDGTSKKAFYIDGNINLVKATDATDATSLWEAATSDDNKQIFNWFSSDKPLNNAVSNAEIKNPDNEYLFVIPQDFSNGNANNDELYVVVSYTIEYKSGSAKPTVSYTVSSKIEKNFEQGKAYTINLNIGLTPIEFNATVTDWVTTENPINDIPVTWN